MAKKAESKSCQEKNIQNQAGAAYDLEALHPVSKEVFKSG